MRKKPIIHTDPIFLYKPAKNLGEFLSNLGV